MKTIELLKNMDKLGDKFFGGNGSIDLRGIDTDIVIPKSTVNTYKHTRKTKIVNKPCGCVIETSQWKKGVSVESEFLCTTHRRKEPQDTLTILCPFCSHPYTAIMNMRMNEIGECETEDCCSSACTGETRTRARLEVVCDHCKRIVYVKDTYRD